MKLTLLHKGLLLVCVPLCFELGVFAWLINLQDQVEQKAQIVNEHKKFNDGANRIMRDIINIAEDMRNYSFYTCLSTNRLDPALADVRRNFVELRKLPANQQDIDAFERGSDYAQQKMAEIREKIRAGTCDKYDLLEAKREIELNINQSMRVAMFRLGRRSLSIQDDDLTKPIRNQIELLLKCALGLSISVAVCAATWYSKHLVDRLSVLSDNAGRLARGESLLPPVGGDDEIAELDKNFHYAAELIEAAKRMREEVTAMITHDLITPLQSVRNYLEMLAQGMLGSLNEKGTRLLSTAQNACDHMFALIDSVLQLEKLRTGAVPLQHKPILLEQLLDKCLDDIRLLAEEKKVAIAESFKHGRSDTVEGDAFWLEQVFANLLSNAVKFSPGDSTVSISTEKADKHLIVRITDQGPGIPDKDKKLIFDRFHRLQSTAGKEGTGLGLPIARELIELHHGSIDLESEEGKGSTFSVRLPLVESAG